VRPWSLAVPDHRVQLPPRLTLARRGGSRASSGLAVSSRQWAQVLLATLLVAGTPVLAVWWLRASGTVSSPVLGVLIGMAVSLVLSQLGRVLWESRPGSEDLLFNELMIWGFLRRRHSQRRLASALDMIGPMSDRRRTASCPLRANEQAELLERLVGTIETRDPYLHGHSRRVARHSWMIAKQMGLGRADVARVRTAAAIHDVGKIETPLAILHKPGALTDEEYATIKEHPDHGAVMAAVLRDSELTAMIRHHHERLDGTGYPAGLSGEQIPLGARIIAVADTFDAITSVRPYRGASPHKKAIDILKQDAGSRLDPEVVAAFCTFYAGRRPIAIWATVASLPERAASWVAGSVGSLASAAKMVAVAALIGGTAATTSALAGPAVEHTPSRATSAPSARTHVRSAAASVPASAHGAGSAGHAARAHTRRAGGDGRAPRQAAVARSVSPTATGAKQASSAANTRALQSPAADSARGAAGGGHSHSTRSSEAVSGKAQGETTSGKSGGVSGTGKVETPGKSALAPGHNKTAESPGKSAEAPGHNKTEEGPGKSAEAPGHSKTEESPGKSAEAPGHDKTEEGAGKSAEAPGQSKQEEPKAEATHGKSEEAHGKG
jgi:HD domain